MGDPQRLVACIVGAVESVRGQQRLAQQAAFFRAFILSCFRDPLGDLAFSELKMKTNHENTKVRKHEKEKRKLD